MRVCVCPRRARLTQPNTRVDMAYAGLEMPSLLSLSLWGLQAGREPDGEIQSQVNRCTWASPGLTPPGIIDRPSDALQLPWVWAPRSLLCAEFPPASWRGAFRAFLEAPVLGKGLH